MRRFLLTLLIVAGGVLLYDRPRAGQLSDELAEQMNGKGADELIPVWIQLHQVQPPAALKAIGGSLALSRTERYRMVVDRLQTGHRQAQSELLKELTVLNRAATVRNVKPHWLVNIVEAEVASSELENLAGRQDIELIFAVPEIIPIEPTRVEPAAASAIGPGSNISFVRAPEAWAAGFTGQGRIICSFDTGIKGDHPAIYNNWKGLDGDSAAAWFDPSDNQSFPHLFYWPGTVSNMSHGTHVMGTLVGHDTATGDTIGIAPDARWISAAVINIWGAAIIDAFEWAADPDGDPNSVDDLPDVINHSWRIVGIGCDQAFFDLIDATEALGIVNIFAAGNEGSAAHTIGNPATRARFGDSLDCFAVGNVDESTTPTIVSSSSRGPSDCDSVSFKPNVCAPGLNIRSAMASGSYGNMGGTSMSSPHVSGLVALLRQKNPDATVDQIKEAILTTTNQYSYALPDNDYGWGIIDCKAALDALPAAILPNVRLYTFNHALINPGDTVVGTLELQNTGTALNNVTAVITGTDSALSVLNGTATFGTIGADSIVVSPDTIRVIVSDTVTGGSVLSLNIVITGDAYSDSTQLVFAIDPPIQRSFVTHNTGRISFSVSGFGTFGLGPIGSGPDVFFDAGGVGFRFDGSENQMYEGGLMITSTLGTVSDGVRSSIAEPDGDFLVMPGGTIKLISPGPIAPEESIARFNDSRAESPLGIELLQHTFAYSSADHDDYIIMQYEIRNTNNFPLSGVYVGLYLDWDVVNWNSNAGGYDASGKFTWEAYNSGFLVQDYRGCRVLDGPEGSSYTDTGKVAWFGSGDGFTEAEKRAALTHGFGSVDLFKTVSRDLLTVVASGPIFLDAGAVDTVAFALVAGDSLEDTRAAALETQTVYDNDLVVDVADSDIESLPTAYSLHQNYPNPFNPTTIIRFDLPERTHVELTVFNILGQEVIRLLDEVRPAGSHHVTWNGKSSLGEEAASGIYAYRLKAGGSVESRKMLLLK